VFPSGLSSGEAAPARQALKPIVIASTVAASSSDRHPYRVRSWQMPNKRSVPEILKLGQNQPLYDSKDHCGRSDR
jgi:hypothetical protein